MLSTTMFLPRHRPKKQWSHPAMAETKMNLLSQLIQLKYFITVMKN
jgi:hypothetical protein